MAPRVKVPTESVRDISNETDEHLRLKCHAIKRSLERGRVPLPEWEYNNRRVDIIGAKPRPVDIMECETSLTPQTARNMERGISSGHTFSWQRPNLGQFPIRQAVVYATREPTQETRDQLDTFTVEVPDISEVEAVGGGYAIYPDISEDARSSLFSQVHTFTVGDSATNTLLRSIEDAIARYDDA